MGKKKRRKVEKFIIKPDETSFSIHQNFFKLLLVWGNDVIFNILLYLYWMVLNRAPATFFSSDDKATKLHSEQSDLKMI